MLYGKSLMVAQRLSDLLGVASSLEGMAGVTQGRGHCSQAVRLLGASCALRRTLGSSLPPAEQQELDARTASMRAALGQEAFAAAWAGGEATNWEQAEARMKRATRPARATGGLALAALVGTSLIDTHSGALAQASVITLGSLLDRSSGLTDDGTGGERARATLTGLGNLIIGYNGSRSTDARAAATTSSWETATTMLPTAAS